MISAHEVIWAVLVGLAFRNALLVSAHEFSIALVVLSAFWNAFLVSTDELVIALVVFCTFWNAFLVSTDEFVIALVVVEAFRLWLADAGAFVTQFVIQASSRDASWLNFGVMFRAGRHA